MQQSVSHSTDDRKHLVSGLVPRDVQESGQTAHESDIPGL
jgi:hypothetical protein